MKKKHREETSTSPSNSEDDDSETSDERRSRKRKDRRRKDGSSRREEEKIAEKMKKKHREETSTSPSNSEDDDSETSDERRSRRRKDRRRKDGSSGREERKKNRKEEKRRRRRERKDRKRDKRRRKSRKHADYDSESGSESKTEYELEELQRQELKPEDVVNKMLTEFPNIGPDLKQLLKMIDDGQAVCIKGIFERSLTKHLKKLFGSLNLKERGDAFFLPSNSPSTLEVVGPLIQIHMEPKEAECKQLLDDNSIPVLSPRDDVCGPKKRTIGPEMPSAELLAAAAKLTEAQTELREAELEEDNELFIGPPPPAMVAEAETANEAERFEEVTRIMGVEGDSPYDVVGVNHKMSPENIKKRYWKMSLLVHPDKCSHPQAHQAFIKLNKAFKELQDPDKRKVLDDQIKLKEEQEAFKVELKAMREAAQWRKLQGISMEGDDELLAEIEVKVAPTRDEWMTTLPPERKPGGMPMHSTTFSKGTKEGRGDTSAWTDTPVDRAQKAKMNYLEAYNEATALASNEDEKKRSSADADLVDKYNKAKRSKTLVEKHQEERVKRSKTKSKQKSEKEKEEWSGKHPWKPWDRETDIVAGRKNVKLDADNMVQGLSSRFSSGNFQRNFL